MFFVGFGVKVLVMLFLNRGVGFMLGGLVGVLVGLLIRLSFILDFKFGCWNLCFLGLLLMIWFICQIWLIFNLFMGRVYVVKMVILLLDFLVESLVMLYEIGFLMRLQQDWMLQVELVIGLLVVGLKVMSVWVFFMLEFIGLRV